MSLLKSIAYTSLAASVLFGCASTTDIPTTAYTTPPITNAATLYVYRDLSMPTKANVEVQVDGKTMALLPNNRFTWINVAPGKHTIAVGYPSFPDMRARLEIDFSSGQTYLIHYDSKFGREVSLFGSGRDPEPGVTKDGRGGYTRIRLFPSNDISRVVEQYQYVVAQP